MLVACIAYMIRCTWLVIGCFTNNAESQGTTWIYWIVFQWTPTVFASTALLYSVRKRDSFATDVFSEGINPNTINHADSHEHDDDSGNYDDLIQPLMLRPQPPEEAFRSFSLFRSWDANDDDDDDSSFVIGSPIPRNYVVPKQQEKSDVEEGHQSNVGDITHHTSTTTTTTSKFIK
jgi:hypothetical protein